MPRFLLVHGFAKNLHAPPFRRPHGANAGFFGWDQLLQQGEASVFSWGISETICFPRWINPFAFRGLYDKERRHIHTSTISADLHTTITTQSPETLVGHSMGCELILHAINTHGLPPSVKQIVFVQADCEHDLVLPLVVQNRIANGSLQFINRYCPWDPLLVLSSIYHLKWRLGLKHAQDKRFQNKLTPLWRVWNLHMSSMQDRLW